jgi:hypothetical protein
MREFFMNNTRQITAIIKDHIEWLATRKSTESLLNTPVVLFLSLAFPGKNWNTGRGNAVVPGSARVIVSNKIKHTPRPHGLGSKKRSRKKKKKKDQ